MKILHYSDKASIEFDDLYETCDILVTTGDLSIFDFGKLLDRADKKPAFGVYGNHCSGTYLERLAVENLHNRVLEYRGLTWGGFQGCLRYKNSELMFTEEEAAEFARTFPYVDILLLHAGPKDMLDDPSDSVHIGSESIAKYVREKQPKFIFCGHQYSHAEMTYGQTRIYRTYGARIIDISI